MIKINRVELILIFVSVFILVVSSLGGFGLHGMGILTWNNAVPCVNNDECAAVDPSLPYCLDGSCKAKNGAVFYLSMDSLNDNKIEDIWGLTSRKNIVPGKYGNAIYFNGIDEYIETTDDLSQWLGTTSSLSFWFKTSQTGSVYAYNSPGITGVEEYGGRNDIFWGWLDPEGKMGVSSGDNAGAKTVQTINDDKWHHIVMVRDNQAGYFYITLDGTIFTQSNPSINLGEARTLSFTDIGRIINTRYNPRYFNGVIDEFAIFNKKLSNIEIYNLYNCNQLTTCTPPPVNLPPPVNVNLCNDFSDCKDPSLPECVINTCVPEVENGCYVVDQFFDVDEEAHVDGKTVTLSNVGNGGAIVVDVDGTLQTIPASATKTVNGIEISNIETFYEDTKAFRSATLHIYYCKYFNYIGIHKVSTDDKGLKTHKISLKSGWNLISSPLIPENKKINSIFKDIKGIEIVYYYDTEKGNWNLWSVNSDVPSDLENFEEGKAYMVKMKEAGEFDIRGTVARGDPGVLPTFTVKKGWNLISLHSLNDLPMVDSLKNVDGKYTSLWTYEDGNYQKLVISKNPNMKPGKGYWIYMNSDGVITP